MQPLDQLKRSIGQRSYQVFKGYQVKKQKDELTIKDHFIVPWEMAHKDCNKIKR